MVVQNAISLKQNMGKAEKEQARPIENFYAKLTRLSDAASNRTIVLQLSILNQKRFYPLDCNKDASFVGRIEVKDLLQEGRRKTGLSILSMALRILCS